MPFVQGHFCAPYLDVPTLRKQPPIFPEVTTNLLLDYLRFRQVLLLRILPEPPETLRQHLLCFTAYSIPYRHVPCVLRTSLHGFSNHHTWCYHTPFMFPRYFRNFQYSCTSSTSYFRTALCAQDVPTTSAFLGNLRFPAVPPLSHGTSAFPRFVLRPRRFSAPGNASQTSCNEEFSAPQNISDHFLIGKNLRLRRFPPLTSAFNSRGSPAVNALIPDMSGFLYLPPFVFRASTLRCPSSSGVYGCLPFDFSWLRLPASALWHPPAPSSVVAVVAYTFFVPSGGP
ncbi:hypothetical protein B0H12DRAFT_1242463 [Mycena haematopus]|nr:hypothetical protein B0H12DRAFT_1242463 [Mycena haematopus]